MCMTKAEETFLEIFACHYLKWINLVQINR